MPRLVEKGGSVHDIRRKKTSIGRLVTNDIHVDDNLASRQHAQIVFDNNSFFIVDNLSLNGTYLNGERIDEARLTDGDEIRIGGQIFQFESTTIDPRLMTGESDTTFHVSKLLDDYEPESVLSERLSVRRRAVDLAPADLMALRASHQNLIILHRLSQAVNATLNPDKLMEVAVRIVTDSLSSRLVSISLADENTGDIVPQAVKVADSVESPTYAFLGPLADRALKERVCICVINPMVPHGAGNIKIGSAMASPLWIKDKIIGLIYVDNDSTSKAYTEADLNLLIAMSNTISIAIENARLYQQLTESLRKIQEQQTQLIQSEKLAGIGTLAAGVAHEINNPLAGIMGMAEAIQSEKDRNRAIEYAGNIMEYAEEAAQIVRDMQSYSRASRGEGLTPVDLNEVIDDALKLAGHTGMTKHLDIRKEPGEITYIMADPGEMKQVFINLIQNSVQAMNSQGRISFSTWMEGGRVFAKVADTGPGIPEEYLDKIYDPFFTTKIETQGTGLGLNIVYRIVTKFSGDINCESELGVGTVFTISFPAGKR